MQAEYVSRSSFSAVGSGILVAMLAVVAVVLPASARAALVKPHGSTHSVTALPPQKVASSPAPAPAPAPTAPAPQASSQTRPPSLPAAPRQSSSPGSGYGSSSGSVRESEVPGAGIPGGDSDPPFPEGLPSHRDPDCLGDCQQEWFEWFDARATAVWVEAQAGGTEKEKEAARLLRQETNEIEVEIKQEGGTPGEWADEPGQVVNGPPQPAGPPQLSTAPPSSPSLPDAISGVGPIIFDPTDLGTWDLSGLAGDLAGLANVGFQLGTMGMAQVMGFDSPFSMGPVQPTGREKGDCPGSFLRANQQVEDPHAATSGCF